MKDKILNFLIIFLLTFLLLNIFTNNKKEEAAWESLVIQVAKDSYSVPASVSLEVENFTGTGVIINPCENIAITKNGEKITVSDCEAITVPKNTKETISLWKYFESFIAPGMYTFETVVWEKKYISQFEIENKGTISKIFVYFIYAPIYNLMILLIEAFSYSLGWAILLITIIIRFLLVYPQHKMMVSQRKLQQIQPKIKEIQEKNKGNAQVLWMELMSLYKKEWVNPMGSCGLLLIQMPILIVLYRVIVEIENPVNYYYVYDFLKPFQIENIATNFYWVDLLWIGWVVGIVLALIVAILQYLQIKLSLIYNKSNKTWVVLEKKKDSNNYDSFAPNPEMINKFMLYVMPVMVWIFTYTFFAWIGLYWWFSTLFTIFQQLIVNKIVKK